LSAKRLYLRSARNFSNVFSPLFINCTEKFCKSLEVAFLKSRFASFFPRKDSNSATVVRCDRTVSSSSLLHLGLCEIPKSFFRPFLLLSPLQTNSGRLL
jgi:hypothetical protein